MISGDWRILYQQDYLLNKTFLFSVIKTDDHEHCEFCREKFYVRELKEGYVTLDDRYVVCKKCYHDFKDDFGFKEFYKEDFERKKLSEILLKEGTEMITGQPLYELKKIEKLLDKLRGVQLYPEKINIIPCYLTIYFRKSPKIEELLEEEICIKIGSIDECIEQLKQFHKLYDKIMKEDFMRLCIKVN